MKSSKHLFGPVPSRRLGLSLGVDIVPLKTCTQNCIYCQLGMHGVQRLERGVFVPIEKVLDELRDRIEAGLNADYITLSGSGEPTLHSELGRLIDGIHELTQIPVAVLTNGTLLFDPAVRADCGRADVVLPSLDAGDRETFQTINRPHPDLDFDRFVEGLCLFRREYAGPIWLEVFLVEGINTSSEQIAKMKGLIEKISPDKVHLNTAVRPTVERDVTQISPEHMARLAEQFGPNAEVIADFSKHAVGIENTVAMDTIFEMLQRRPCTMLQIASSLGLEVQETLASLKTLQAQKRIEAEHRQGQVYFKAI
ncbi:MAG: radical SAM protein [Sedimentisphaerales bacterium]|nr:radical SAM protein [Sedimentisphaerales bacterium]